MKIFYKVLKIVTYLHQKGVVHRDLKLENFMFGNNKDDLKLIDFGLSERFYYEDKLTKEIKKKYLKEMVGTSIYVAPEVLRTNYDYKSDMWSLGVMLFIMLSGSPPFCGKDKKQLFQSIQDCSYNFKAPVWDKVST